MRVFWIAALAALVVRGANLGFAAASSPFFGGLVVDDRAYHEWGLRIAGGEWVGEEPFFLSPLLPYVLGALYAVFGEVPVAWLVVQVVLSAATAGAVAVVAGRVFGERAGWIAGGLAALYGPLVFVSESLLSETLHLALVWGGIVLLTSSGQGRNRGTGRGVFVAGVLAGLGALARNYYVLALPALALWVWRARGGRAAGAFAGGAALALAPSLAHNLAASGEPILVTSSGGVNLYLGNHAGANGRLHPPPGIEVEALLDPARLGVTFGALAARATGRELAPGEVSAHFRGRATDWMRSDPGAFLALVGRRLLLVTEALEFPGERNYYQAARLSPVLRWTPARWPLVFGLAAAGVFALRGRGSRAAPVLCAGGAALAALALFWVTDRFRVSLVPAAIVLAGGGAQRLLRERGRGVATATAAAVFALSIGLSWGRPTETAMSHYNIGIQYHRRSEYTEAEEEARAAIALDPDLLNGHGLLVEALRGQGRTAEAQEAARTYVRLAREKGIPVRRGRVDGR